MSPVLPAVLSLYEVNFAFAAKDVKTLLRLHDDESGGGRGRPPDAVEVLKRSAVILSVTAWEAFIEDSLAAAFEQRLEKASAPQDMEGTFRAVAAAWLNPGGPSRPQPADLVHWTGDGWKRVLKAKFKEAIENLHSPNSGNIRELSKKYLGWDLTSRWKWGSVTAPTSCTRLDALIERRGELVHRGKEVFDRGGGARRKEAEDALGLITRLVACSSQALEEAE
jgi:hypothetical protein